MNGLAALGMRAFATASALRDRAGLIYEQARLEDTKSRLAACGSGVAIHRSAVILGPENVCVGSDVLISPGCWLSAVDAPLTIGNKVLLAPRVAFITGDHHFRELGSFMFDVHTKRLGDDLPIIVEDDVWIAYGACVLKGVTIGRGSITGAGALVMCDIPPYAIFAGTPAAPVGRRFTYDEVIIHETRLYGSVLTGQASYEGE